MQITKQTLFIVDDDASVCNSLRCLFESVKFNVATYNSAHEFLDKFNLTMQGCIIIDVRMPVMSGLELLENLNGKKVRLPIIMMSGHGEISMAIRAMKLGAVDFVLKPFNDQSLLDAVQKYTQPTCSISFDEAMYAVENINERLHTLSERERQVLNLISDGRLNKEIAYLLVISMSTVEAHRASIMRKMKAKNVAQLIKFHLKSQLAIEFHDIQAARWALI